MLKHSFDSLTYLTNLKSSPESPEDDADVGLFEDFLFFLLSSCNQNK